MIATATFNDHFTMANKPTSNLSTLLEFLQADNALHRVQKVPRRASVSSRVSLLIKPRSSNQNASNYGSSPDDVEFVTLPSFIEHSRRHSTNATTMKSKYSHSNILSSNNTSSANPFRDLAPLFQDHPCTQSAIRQILVAPRKSPELIQSLPAELRNCISVDRRRYERDQGWEKLCADLKEAFFSDEDQVVEFVTCRTTCIDALEEGKRRWENYVRVLEMEERALERTE